MSCGVRLGVGSIRSLALVTPRSSVGKPRTRKRCVRGFAVAARLGWDGAYIFGSFQQPGAHAYGILGESQAP